MSWLSKEAGVSPPDESPDGSYIVQVSAVIIEASRLSIAGALDPAPFA